MSKERFVTVTAKCGLCGKEVPLKLTVESVEEYYSPNRRCVQDIFPYLTAEERELLISHTCGECWDKMFSFEDDDEDYEDLEEYDDGEEDIECEDDFDCEEYYRANEISCEELKEF